MCGKKGCANVTELFVGTNKKKKPGGERMIDRRKVGGYVKRAAREPAVKEASSGDRKGKKPDAER